MLPYLILFIAGIVGGFIAGLIGIGGGIIYVLVIPIALRHLGISEAEIPQFTIANSLFAIFIASALVNAQHFKNKIYYREILLIGLFSSLASIVSLKFIVNTHYYSFFIYNLITLLFIIFLFINTILNINKNISLQAENSNALWFGVVGIIGGIISSLSGLGGGIVIIPFLSSFLNYDIKKSSIISSGVIMVTALVSTVYNLVELPSQSIETWSLGYIIFPISLTLIFGVILSTASGVYCARKFSSTQIIIIYSVFLLIVILKKSLELYELKF